MIRATVQSSSCNRKQAIIPAMAVLLLCLVTMVLARTSVVLTFKDSTIVHDTSFTLGMIASVSSNDTYLTKKVAATVVGVSAPPSHGRFLAVSDFVSYQLRHRFPEVAFECKGAVRPFIRTGYKTLTVKAYEQLIRTSCQEQCDWPKGSWQMEIKNGSDSIRVLDALQPVGEVTGFKRPYTPKGNSNLTLLIRQAGKEFHLPIRIFFTVQCPVVTAVCDIARGEVISATAVAVKEVDLTRFTPDPFCALHAVVGMRAARSIRKGTILHKRLVKAIPAVEKGDKVSIVHNGNGLSIIVAGTARESGYTGEKIWVENGASNKLIRARIVGNGKVAVSTGRNRS